MWFEKNPKISLIITLIIAGTIFYLSSLTFPPSTGGSLINSTLYHFFAFFFLTIFLLITITKGEIKYLIIFLGILIAVFYGFLDEVHQLFVPGRMFSLYDILLNTTGILFASLIYTTKIKLRKIYKD